MKRFGSKRRLGEVTLCSERVCDIRETARGLRDRSLEDALRHGVKLAVLF